MTASAVHKFFMASNNNTNKSTPVEPSGNFKGTKKSAGNYFTIPNTSLFSIIWMRKTIDLSSRGDCTLILTLSFINISGMNDLVSLKFWLQPSASISARPFQMLPTILSYDNNNQSKSTGMLWLYLLYTQILSTEKQRGLFVCEVHIRTGLCSSTALSVTMGIA